VPLKAGVLTAALISGATILALLFVADERNRLVFLQPQGMQTSGTKFGVIIGEGQTSAREKLERQEFKYVLTERSGNCGNMSTKVGELLDLYRDYSWRRGGLCLLVSGEGVVRAIGWDFQPFSF